MSKAENPTPNEKSTRETSELSVHEQFIKLIKNGEPLPDAWVNRRPQGQAGVPGSNLPDNVVPSSRMEGGVPVEKE